MSVPLFFLMVPWASLQFVIEAVPDHTHVLYLHLQVDKIFRETCSQGRTL